jgi:type I restriction enzyme S subunit
VSGLPRGWATATLAEVAIPRGERVSPSSHKEKRFIGLEHVEAHSTRILGSIPAADVKSSASVFCAGDVLYGRLRPYLNKVAKPDFEGLASAEFIVFPDQEHLRSGFLKHRLNASDFVSFSSRLNAGDRPRVDFEQIGDFEVVLPPPAEQLRIVEKLEELLSDLDAGVAALERVRANLKRYRAAVLKAAVEGRLTEKWRAAHPKVEPASNLLERILAERRKKWEAVQFNKYADKGQSPPKGWKDKYSEPVRPEVDGLPKLPEGWCWATVDQCSWEVTVGHVGPMKDRYEDSGLPFLRSQNVRPFRFDRAGLKFISKGFDLELSKSRLFGGEVLAVRSGNIGDACLYPETDGPGNCADLVISRLVPSMSGDYVVAYLNSPIGRSRVLGKQTGSALPHFNVGAMSRSVIPLPPGREQTEIASSVAERLSQGEEALIEMERSIARSSLLRQAILKRAFEGNLVQQDPKDEPASELLARIRAELRAGKGLIGKGEGVRKIRTKIRK